MAAQWAPVFANENCFVGRVVGNQATKAARRENRCWPRSWFHCEKALGHFCSFFKHGAPREGSLSDTYTLFARVVIWWGYVCTRDVE